MRIGLLDQTTSGWSAGASFSRMQLACLQLALESGDQLVFLAQNAEIQPEPPAISVPLFRDLLPEEEASFEKIGAVDVLLPLRENSFPLLELPIVGWIPDLQHKFLPHLFGENHCQARENSINKLLEKSSLVLLSSESVKDDFSKFYPAHKDKARVGHFPSIIWSIDLPPEPREILEKYHLPPVYALVANQFWKHKNHSILPPALAELKTKGKRLDLVLSGLPADYRDPLNSHLSSFFQDCARLGVSDQVHFLGHLNYRELLDLMRCASVVIQPSLFEGWSTSIEDCKALGKTLVCSDLTVHREQAPEALGFFDPESPEGLASILLSQWERLDVGHQPQKELQSLSEARERSKAYGQLLLKISREAIGVFEKNPAGAKTASLGDFGGMLKANNESIILEQTNYIKFLETENKTLQSELFRCHERLESLKNLPQLPNLKRKLNPLPLLRKILGTQK